MHLSSLTGRLSRAAAWIRAHVTRRRVTRGVLAGALVAVVGVTGEAFLRARIVPPAERAPSALYTRPVAWDGSQDDREANREANREDGREDGREDDRGNDDAATLIGPVSPELRESRDPVALGDVPQHLIDAVLAVEDQRFYQHHGIDPRRIAGALVANVRAGGVAEGGSTITQQLAKNLFLSASRTPVRKVREAALATVLELRYSKRQILEAYLNEAYFGQDDANAIRGVGAASRFYFGKSVRRVSLAEAALLAGMIRAPNRLAPNRHPDDARARRNLVLGLMLDQGRIDSSAAARATRARVSTRTSPASTIDARYFRDFIARSGTSHLPERGAAVYTTLDAALQRSAERAVMHGLARLGRRGAQGALVAIDPRTGDVLAMVGGADYATSQFNRATDAHRQPGSAFKPIVALAALEAGEGGAPPAFTLASDIEDEPLTVTTNQGPWRPANYDNTYRGHVSFREALEQSLNVPFARIGLAVGPDRIVSAARRLGVTSSLKPVPSIALGSNEVTLLELVRAYGVLATEGNLAATRTTLGRRIRNSAARGVAGRDRDDADDAAVDRMGNVGPAPDVARVADPAATFLVTSALMGVVQHGTGRALGAQGFGGDIAGKTGTSNNWRDAWFIAYTPDIVVGAWVGYDDGTSLRLAGASAALPIVGAFLDGTDVPGATFEVPDGVERAYTSAGGWGWCGAPEYFLEGTAPAGNACGFRAIADEAHDWIGDLRDALRQMVRDRIRAERESRQHQRVRPHR